MSEEWLIDGYNLLRHLASERRKGLSREVLLDRLAGFASAGRRRVLVVFDGKGPDLEWETYRTKNFQVVYSQDVSADSFIEKAVRQSQGKSSQVVVTRDRAICNMARGCGARVFSPAEFADMLKTGSRENESILHDRRQASHGFHRPFDQKLKSFILIALSCLWTVNAWCFARTGFRSPGSVAVDAEAGFYYVSNANGSPSARDQNGFISKVSGSGRYVIQPFIGGSKNGHFLRAPKGLVLHGTVIYVADADTVKAFDKKTGRFLSVIDLRPYRVRFLNAITTDEKGTLYAADSQTNRIFRIVPGTDPAVSVLAEGNRLGRPGGLVLHPDGSRLIVAARASGEVLEVSLSGRIRVLHGGLRTLDGVDYDSEGNLYVSSFDEGVIYKAGNYGRGPLTSFLTGLKTPGNLAVDRSRRELLIPSFKGNTLTTISLSSGKNHEGDGLTRERNERGRIDADEDEGGEKTETEHPIGQ